MHVKQLSSADFRKHYASLMEPHEVTSYGHIIGTWIPAGHALPADESNPTPEDEESEASSRMTIRPVKAQPKPMVATQKRIIDPVQRTQPEREIWQQLQAKMLPSEGSRKR